MICSVRFFVAFKTNAVDTGPAEKKNNRLSHEKLYLLKPIGDILRCESCVFNTSVILDNIYINAVNSNYSFLSKT